MESRRKPQGHLFRKYLLLFVILISGALLASGLLESYFAYQEHKTALVRLQRATAPPLPPRSSSLSRRSSTRLIGPPGLSRVLLRRC